MTLVILAAGMGSRYGGLKQIDPIGPNGEFIIDYSIYDALQAGCDRVVFIIKEESLDAFRETVGSRIESRIKVEYAFQRPDDLPFTVDTARSKPWGTAQALLACRDLVNEPFMIINADDFYGRHSFQLTADFLRNSKDEHTYCMPGYVLANTLSANGHVARGVCQAGGDQLLTGIVERKKIMRIDGETKYTLDEQDWHDLDENSLVSMNFWGFNSSIYKLLGDGLVEFLRDPQIDLLKDEFYLGNAIDNGIKSGFCKVKVLPTDAKWFGVTYQSDRPEVVQTLRALIDSGEYPLNLWG